MAQSLPSLVDQYLSYVFERDPISSTKQGIHDYDFQLGDFSSAAVEADLKRRREFLTLFQSIDPGTLSADQKMDQRVAIIDLETTIRRMEDLRIHERAPYWYFERLGGALSDLMSRKFAPAEERGRRLLARLNATPDYLGTAKRTLTTDAPPLWVEMGITNARGLQLFLREAVPGFAAELSPALRSDIEKSTAAAQSAVTDFVQFLQDLHGRAKGHFACGPEHFDFLLKRFHLVDMDHKSLYQFGLDEMAKDKARIEAYAKQIDPTRTWVQQIDEVKSHHPEPADFKNTYEKEMWDAREHCLEQDLITFPEGEVCHMVWLPLYLRASLPIAVMGTTPPFEPGLESEWLITPIDPDATPERKEQHARDNCYAFARSIALHEIYPGHHLQKVHHKLATANSPMRRHFSCPVFVEGWGLYTEDLFEETGFIHEPAVMLFKLRNALWRSVRVVIDSGLHTRNMSFEDAVKLLTEEVCLDPHMAEGEVRRYSTHNNPTYPSSYLVGKTLIQKLRATWKDRRGAQYTIKEFHDRLLSYGSPPVKLVADRMLSE